MLKFIVGLLGLFTIQFFLKAFMTLNFNILLGPMVTTFWRHAKDYAKPNDRHNARSPVKCPDCNHIWVTMPD